MNTAEMTAKMAAGKGFIAALDQSGGSTPKALAGYGIMYNTRYLKANKLTPPKEWTDLLAPAWHGHVAMTSPHGYA